MTMANKIKLNRSTVEKLAPIGGKQTIFWDTEVKGFGVRVNPGRIADNGSREVSRLYFCQGRLNRETIKISIKAPGITPEAARKTAKLYLGKMALGIDPRQSKKSGEKSATLGDLMHAYVDALDAGGKKSASEVRSTIRACIERPNPKLWKKSANDIDLKDCIKIVGDIVDKGHKRQADKVRSYIRAAYSAAINAEGDINAPPSLRKISIKHNPARDMRKVKGATNAKDRALTLAELRAYWRRVKQEPENCRSLLILHLLTGGQRQEQLARVTRADIDFDDNTMVILDYKGRRSEPRRHVIPLLPVVVEAINRLTMGGPFVFSWDGGIKRASEAYLAKQVQRICADMEKAGELEQGRFTAGSLRATVETRLAAKPYRVTSDVLAQLLSHGMGGVQARHYQKHDFYDEKLEALEMLHRMVEGASEPQAQIIPFNRGSVA
jgi:integrase